MRVYKHYLGRYHWVDYVLSIYGKQVIKVVILLQADNDDIGNLVLITKCSPSEIYVSSFLNVYVRTFVALQKITELDTECIITIANFRS